MRLTTSRPVIEMTREELVTVRKFLDIIEDNEIFNVYDWSQIIDDFPYLSRVVSSENNFKGCCYDIKVIE